MPRLTWKIATAIVVVSVIAWVYLGFYPMKYYKMEHAGLYGDSFG